MEIGPVAFRRPGVAVADEGESDASGDHEIGIGNAPIDWRSVPPGLPTRSRPSDTARASVRPSADQVAYEFGPPPDLAHRSRRDAAARSSRPVPRPGPVGRPVDAVEPAEVRDVQRHGPVAPDDHEGAAADRGEGGAGRRPAPGIERRGAVAQVRDGARLACSGRDGHRLAAVPLTVARAGQGRARVDRRRGRRRHHRHHRRRSRLRDGGQRRDVTLGGERLPVEPVARPLEQVRRGAEHQVDGLDDAIEGHVRDRRGPIPGRCCSRTAGDRSPRSTRRWPRPGPRSSARRCRRGAR